ncbi:MAG: ATP-grasp domain-containing protein [Ignavibacteriales bacterium]|nr:ATP-grasp domain-containing protein [Ignavibacteriales bacterium]
MNIAVTGLNATDNPGPGVPVIRSLKEVKEISGNIIGLVYDPLEPGIYLENLADKCYQIPYPSSGLENLFNRISLINEIEKIDLIIPTLDSELYGFVKLQDKLRGIGIKTFLPTFEQLNIRGKDKLFDFCKENGIKVPKNILVASAQELYKIPDQFGYPVVIKGIFYEAYIANNFDEAHSAFNKLSYKWGFPIIVQEFVKGDEFNVVALGDGKGKTIGAVAMRKLYITDKGKGWSGVTIDEPNILSVSHKVIEKTKWRSGMELEFIKDSITNEYYLLEINPRFPAWVYLAPSAGQNLPYALVKLANEESVPQFDSYEIGKIFVRCSWDLITDIKIFERITVKGEN